jgi:hypothetical protein
MNFIQPQGGGDDCCCNGITGSSCTPQAWANACSIGYYLTDLCEENYLFRIKKDGTVIYGVSDANSYSFEPPSGEVATYTIEYCLGPEPCTWIELVEAEVDTTSEDACPMGIQGQAYILEYSGSSATPQPANFFYWCNSLLVIRVAAMAAPGQVITHLWIDDSLWTPNTNYAGAISDDEAILGQSLCDAGIGFNGPADVHYNDTTYPQRRIQLPISFDKQVFSVRARQSDGTIVACNLVAPHCSVYYNAASVTLPTWNGLSLSCSGTGSMPMGFMSTPAPVRFWCQSYESTIEISGDLSGLFAFFTCYSTTGFFEAPVAEFTCTYNFKCSGQVRWIDANDPFPRPVYSGTYSFDHTVTWTTKLFINDGFAGIRPGFMDLGGLIALVTSNVESTITGHDDFYDAVGSGINATDFLTLLNITGVTNNIHSNPDWFSAELFDILNCGTPRDEDVFRWKWQGPQFSSGYWGVEIAELAAEIGVGLIAPSPIASTAYMTATWPVDTSFVCNLPEGSYFDQTASATASQFQVIE